MKALISTNGNSTAFENPEPGTYPGICFKIVDLGTQLESYQGGPEKEVPKVLLFWELNEKMSDGVRPFSVFKEYSISLNEKANLRKDLESWTGVTFSDAMVEKFNQNPGAQMRRMLGKCCLLNISKHPGNGRPRVNGTMALVKGTPCPAPVNTQVYFDLADFKQDVFDALPEWIKDKIVLSLEYKALQAPSAAPANHGDGVDDDIPF